MKKRMKVFIGLVILMGIMVPQPKAAETPVMVVGRIYYIEQNLLRFVPGEKDWVATVRDAPFGVEDTLFSISRGRAELFVPNGTWIRLGSQTQIQFINLGSDVTEADLATGYARFYNKGGRTVVKVQSPFGYVLANPGTVFDFYVGENSVEVLAVKGKVSFVHGSNDNRYDVMAGSPSILADQRRVSAGEGTVDPEWDRWNRDRERFWTAKLSPQIQSSQYLPPSLRQDAYVLKENGRWERVWYQGREFWFWRPTVVVGWSPFTVGRWVDWYGDQTWIPAEPFGYVTHHYGNWVYIGNYWYWAPPVERVRGGLPLLDVGSFWYPGRVGWIRTGFTVGWIPLAPYETYYCTRFWGGPHTVVVNNVKITNININVRNYAHVDRAVVVPQDRFYGVDTYRDVRLPHVNTTTIVNNYRPAPVVNITVINNYTFINKRHEYTNIILNEKPHQAVVGRIMQNQTVIREGKKDNAALIQQQVKNIRPGMVTNVAKIEPPKPANYLVPAGQETLPRKDLRPQPKEFRDPGEEVTNVTLTPVRPDNRGTVTIPKHMAPARPGQPHEIVIPEHVAPAQPEHPGHVLIPEYKAPARKDQPHQVVIPEHAVPVGPGKPEHPEFVFVPEHKAQVKAGLPHQVVVPDHVTPRPIPRGQSAAPGSANPQPGKNGPRPEGKNGAKPDHDRPLKPHAEGKDR
jgi:hypothetical protein